MHLDRDVAGKKRLLPIFIVGSGALFVMFGVLDHRQFPRFGIHDPRSRGDLFAESSHDQSLYCLWKDDSERNVVHKSGILRQAWCAFGIVFHLRSYRIW